MLPPNLFIVSLVIFLATSVSTAPVEEKEQEEVEAPEQGEGELSEEEGFVGMLPQVSVASVSGGSVSSVQSTGSDGAAGSSAGSAVLTGSSGFAASPGSPESQGSRESLGFPGSAGSPGFPGSAGSPSFPGFPGSAGSPGFPGSAGSPGSAGFPGSPGSAGSPSFLGSASAAEHPGDSGIQTQAAGNGQKLLNGGGGGGAGSQTGVSGSFEAGFSHLDYTGTTELSSHDFLFGLMSGRDPLSPDVHVNIPGHMDPPSQLDSVISSGGSAASSVDLHSLDLPAGHIHQSGIGQTGLDHTSLGSGPGQSLSSSGSSHSGALEAAASPWHADADREQTGNGRQTHLSDTNAATDLPLSLADLRTDLTGLGLGHDVTGVNFHTDLVTAVTDLTATDTVSADPTGSSLDSSHSPVMDHTQAAGSVTEQYNTPGQGPEGAENVELEDTC
ncbi:hypothetical protein JOB18_045870 [Solea senegalensis]|uniref:Uncharacterized protein n=1 Tax=Solea senegalensis TaxID=28829 RepID=A0AAV6R9N2_SOLSE|nr:hypothetical protein JOB18_045870 [Solea senegalensis]